MYKFILINGAACPAIGKVVIGDRELPFGDEAARDKILRGLKDGKYEVASLDPPPDELISALDGQKFTGSRELNKFISAWEQGETPETIESLSRKNKALRFMAAKSAGVEIDIPIEEQAALTATAVSGLQVSTVADGSEWRPGIDAKLGQTVTFGINIYKCILPHVTQADWPPDLTPALWAKTVAEGVIAEWEQRYGHNPYQPGDKVLFKGKTYKALATTTYSPEQYAPHWELA